MRIPLLLVAILQFVGACADSADREGPADPLGASGQRMVGGTPSTEAQDATVMLTENGQFACTATLIAPNLIVTARHCVSELNEDTDCGVATSDHPASGIGIQLGADATGNRSDAMGLRLFLVQSANLCGADIALLQLDRDLPGVRIAPVRFTPLKVSETTVAVGYGDDGSGQQTDGRFQRTGVKILALGPSSSPYKTQSGQSLPMDVPAGEIASSESTCFGDSGGPLFDAQGMLVGVTSRGIDDACIDRPTIWTGLPQHEKLIRDAAAAAGHPLPASKASPSTTPPSKPDPSSKTSGDGSADDGSDPGLGPNQASADATSGDDTDHTVTKKPKTATSPTVLQPSGYCGVAATGTRTDASSFGRAAFGLLFVGALRRRRSQLTISRT
jgi:hypothetical protein